MRKAIGEVARTFLPKSTYVAVRSLLLKQRLDRRFWSIKEEYEALNQIAVIGDSHSRFFSGATPETEETIHFDINGEIHYNRGDDKRFCAFDLGPALAYSLNKRQTTVRALEKYEWLSVNLLEGRRPLICAFGEIDIRAHVFKHVSPQKSFKDIINTICDNYEQFLHIVDRDGSFPVVWGPIASQKDSWKAIAPNPAIGSESDRNKAVECFNIEMRQRCEKNGWGFFTIYDQTMDNEYRTKEEYIYDMCHLGDNAKELFNPRFYELLESIRSIQSR